MMATVFLEFSEMSGNNLESNQNQLAENNNKIIKKCTSVVENSPGFGQVFISDPPSAEK